MTSALHNSWPRPVAIIGAVRIPFCRSYSAYRAASNQDMMTAALGGLVDRFALRDKTLGDVAIGAVIKHSRDWNLARESVLGAGLAAETPAYDVVRACGTSLEAVTNIANKIALGQMEVGIAGGTDTVSDTPIVYSKATQKLLMSAYTKKGFDKFKQFLKFRPRHFKPEAMSVKEPRTGLSMGESTELMAKEWNISRQDQDAFALASHQKAATAWADGFYDDLVLPFRSAKKDNNVRPETSIEKLASLRAAFDKTDQGTLTAGNSTPLTDGAACVLLASADWAMNHRIPVLAYLSDVRVAAVDFVGGREGLLMAPTYAVSNLLKAHDLALQDFDFYEIHEAFAAQVLCTLKAWESDEFCREKLGRPQALGSIDPAKMNIKGGSVALGHPFAATGARLVGTLAKLLHEKGSGRGLISVCTGGGMGIAAILEAA
ncbi:MAG: acetyl-CoA C-acetyltransferase [Gammaproteobacteria bacterium]|nr:acetyl-CoA C-acetyltransferase [Gammaproteobacteria bacterium]